MTTNPKDDKTRAYLDAMESEVMTRMSDNKPQLLARPRATDAAVAGLATSVKVLTVIAGSQADLGRWAAGRAG